MFRDAQHVLSSNGSVDIRDTNDPKDDGAEWEICNADVYFRVDTLVGRIVDQDKVERHFVEDS